jgi:hypothetical protein
MRGCANARSRQYFSYFAFFSARDPGDANATASAFAIFYPIDVAIQHSTVQCEYYFEFNARLAGLIFFIFRFDPFYARRKLFSALQI